MTTVDLSVNLWSTGEARQSFRMESIHFSGTWWLFSQLVPLFFTKWIRVQILVSHFSQESRQAVSEQLTFSRRPLGQNASMGA